MNNNVAKTLLVLLMCLSFIGQAMATTMMSYQMMSMSKGDGQPESQPHSMPMMDHSQHNMMNTDTELSQSNSENCCDTSCTCMTSHCTTMAALLFSHESFQPYDVSQRIYSISNLTADQSPNSLFRPPITS